MHSRRSYFVGGDFAARARLAGRVTVGAQELVELVQIGNRLADEGDSADLADEWFRANAALARTADALGVE